MTAKITPRDYQDAATRSIFDYFQKDTGNPIVAMPTGTGKAIVIGDFIRRACYYYPGTRIMMLTHVKELIDQNMKTLLRLWPTAPTGVYSAGLGRREQAQVTFAGIQSVHRRPEDFEAPDIIKIDECHLLSPKNTSMYRSFIEAMRARNPFLKVVGYSATPFRMGQGMLTDEGGIFTDVCFDLTSRDAFNWLILQGWLTPLVPKQTSHQLDLSGVRMQSGEFVLADLQEKIDHEYVTVKALTEAVHLAHDRHHWLVFASGIAHAEHIAAFLNDQFDIPAAAVHSQMDGVERDRVIADFKAGRLRALVNNNILTTGFDFPEIDCIVMLRPTASPSLWVQMLGRGTRPVFTVGMPLTTVEERLAANSKKNCLVLDFAGNTKRLGPINDPVLPRKKGKGPPGPAPVRLCEVCGCYSHASARFCENPDCGVEFPRAVKISTSADTEELIAGVTPRFETIPVTRVIYSVHKKEGRPDSMKVTYYCGLRTFKEYICLDHGGYAGRLARQWWEMRCPWGVPPSVHDGMLAIDHLRVPKAITIMRKGKYDEIAGYEFA